MMAQSPHPTSVRTSWSSGGQCAKCLEQKRRDCEREKSQEDRKTRCCIVVFLFPRRVCLRKKLTVYMRTRQRGATGDDNPCRTSGYANPFVSIRCPRCSVGVAGCVPLLPRRGCRSLVRVRGLPQK